MRCKDVLVGLTGSTSVLEMCLSRWRARYLSLGGLFVELNRSVAVFARNTLETDTIARARSTPGEVSACSCVTPKSDTASGKNCDMHELCRTEFARLVARPCSGAR